MHVDRSHQSIGAKLALIAKHGPNDQVLLTLERVTDGLRRFSAEQRMLGVQA